MNLSAGSQQWLVAEAASFGADRRQAGSLPHAVLKLPLINFCVCILILMSGRSYADDGGTWLHPKVQKLSSDLMGPFVPTSDGGILAIDSQNSYVSSDGGKTWSDPRPLTGVVEQGIQVSNERTLLRTKDGAIIAAFMNLAERNWTWNNELFDAPEAKLPTYVMRSLDDGKTWQNVQKLHDDWTGACRDMIETSDGRVIFTSMKLLHNPGRHSVLTYSSTDDGQTWTPSNLIDLGGKGHHGGVTEPALVELEDGRIWMLIRTNWGEFWSAYSYDGGKFWRTIQPSGIAASSAPAMLSRLASGRLLLVWNRLYPEGKNEWPLSGGDGLWSETPVSNHREELSIAFSDDDGATWSDPVVIAHNRESEEQGSKRWLSYPYVYEPEPGRIWLTTMQGGLRIAFDEKDFIDDRKVVVAFGDSTTATRGALPVYAQQLQQHFDGRGERVQVINAGVGGNTTADGRKRFETDVLAHDPDVVIMQFGLNDTAIDIWKDPPASGPRVSAADYVAHLRHYIQACRQQDAQVLLMTPNPRCWTPKMRELYGKPPYDTDDPDGFNLLLRDYAERVRKLADEEDVPLVDIYAAFEARAGQNGSSLVDLIPDGVHPNAEGHRLVTELLLKAWPTNGD